MPPTKPKSDYSVNSLSKELGHDRRTIDKLVAHLVPTRVEGKTKYYRLEDVQDALKNKPGQTLREKKLVEEIENWRIRNKVLREELLEESQESAWLFKIAKETSAVLWQKLVNEMPAELAKMDEPTARERAKGIYNEVMQSWREVVKKPEVRAMLEAKEAAG